MMEEDRSIGWERDLEQGQEYDDLHNSDHVQEAAKLRLEDDLEHKRGHQHSLHRFCNPVNRSCRPTYLRR